MKRVKLLMNQVAIFVIIFGLTACGSDKVPKSATEDEAAASPKVVAQAKGENPDSDYIGTAAKPGSPYSIGYRLVGSPIVGSPLVIDLRVRSLFDNRPVKLNYRINDASSMAFADAQPLKVDLQFADNEKSLNQQVTVIPQREGRFYLNVSASFDDENGTTSTITAIPIQVGTGTRELLEHGKLELDANGEAVRVLTND